VQSGETLRGIAGETKYDGVSLEQMMVGLFRANPNAFIGDNVNRMKAGAILNVPDKATVAAVPPSEARQVYVAQVGDWNRYRQGVATAAVAAPAKEAQPAQAASGKVSAKVEEKVAPAEQARDQVKVARTEVPAKGAGDKPGAAEEDLVAKDRALKEAQERLALLEKNVVELQKLVDLKAQRLAELQGQAAGKDAAAPAAPVAAVKPAEPAKPSEPAPAAEPPKAAEAPPQAEPPKPAAEAPKAPEVKPPEPPKPAPAPAAEPGLIDQLLDNPLALAAGGGALALLAGLFMAKRRREEQVVEMSATAPNPSSLGPNSVFRMTGGQSVDTANMPMPTGEFSQTGPGTIDTDEVDPVAEADVYMAYGRDAQAEEILVEALRKDPQRLAIHAKLLEIYANRKSLKQFDTLASELYSQTGGVGPEWEKVAALGLALDPENPLYATDRRSRENETSFMDDAAFAAPVVAAAAVAVPSAFGLTADGVEEPTEGATFPAIVSPEASFDAAAAELAEATNAASADLDFDLAGAAPLVDEAAAAVEPVAQAAQAEFGTLDFDLGQSASTAVADAEAQFTPEGTMILGNELAVSEDAALLDFEIDADGGAAETMVNPAAVQEDMVGDLTVVDGMAGLSVEFAEEALAFEGQQDDAGFQVQAAPVPEFDMTSINLDLSAEGPGSAAPVAPADNAGFESGDDVGTKLALAKAYEEMGDLDQACELLEEVIAEGSGDVVQQAKQTIARLRG
jgi:pilus assembly protein FimV